MDPYLEKIMGEYREQLPLFKTRSDRTGSARSEMHKLFTALKRNPQCVYHDGVL